MAQAFDGVRIIDFTQVLAGRFTTHQLALLGADVIKIEAPGSAEESVDLVRAGFQFDADGPQTERPPPTLGQHTEEVLTEMGLSDADIARFKEAKAI